jgi:hypothetical protein
MAAIGSVAWLDISGGRLSFGERLKLIAGLFGALREGIRLGRHAKRSGRRELPLDRFDPPETPMVNAARAHLLATSGVPMANHCFRTAYWTMFVLDQHVEVTPALVETAWVAALLHDVGLDRPPARGDFSAGGVEVVKTLAHEHRWDEGRVHDACEAIATNLSTRVDRDTAGVVAWAMNVGGTGEIGFPAHRAQMHPDRIAELEQRYPRTGLRSSAMELIKAEARRVRGGRFGVFRWIFPMIMRD